MAGPLYHADGAHGIRLVALDGLSLLYHEASGTTHIVAPPAPEILTALQAGPADAHELLRRLAASFELEDDAAEPAIRARLTELEAAGLVWRA